MGEGEEKKDIKPQPNQPQQTGQCGRRNWRRGATNYSPQGGSTSKFKGKTKEIENDIFDMGGSHDAALFSSETHLLWQWAGPHVRPPRLRDSMIERH